MSGSLLWALPLLSAVGVPLLLAASVAVPSWRSAVPRLTPWAALPALLIAVLPGLGGEIRLDGFLLGAHLGVDVVGRAFLFVTALVWLASGWFARATFAADPHPARLCFFWLGAMAGNVTLVLAQDMLTFYSGFAVMSFASYGLVVHSRRPAALRAGRVYLTLVVLGEVLLYLGMVMLAPRAGSVEFPSLDAAPFGTLAVLLILLGFGTKAGLLPLHVSMPLAYAAAPLPAAAALAGAMVNAGLLGWLRFLPGGAPGVIEISPVLVMAGLGAAFYGALVGVTQVDARSVLAYSSISQMGLMTAGVGAVLAGTGGAPLAAVTLYALHHGLAKAALFLGVGMASEATHSGPRLWVAAGLLFPALALAGAPWTSGAVAKTALKASLGALPAPWPSILEWLLPLAAVGTTLLMVRFLVLVWRQTDAAPVRRADAGQWRAWGVLLLAVALAAWAWPGSGGAAREALMPAKILPLSWPIAAGVLLAWLAWRAVGSSASRDRPLIPAGDLLAVVEWILARARVRPGRGPEADSGR